MDAALTLRHARRSAGLSLRGLAARSGTSHATLAAYESGRVIPKVDTLDRVLRAAGFATDVTLRRRADASPDERAAKGDELLQVLELAAQFPARHLADPRHPRFPPALDA